MLSPKDGERIELLRSKRGQRAGSEREKAREREARAESKKSNPQRPSKSCDNFLSINCITVGDFRRVVLDDDDGTMEWVLR